MLESCGKVVLPSIKKNEDQPDDKGWEHHVFIKHFCGMEDNKRCGQKENLNKMKKKQL